MKKTALIIGITGGFGYSVASALQQTGWNIRALHRNPEKAQHSLPHLQQVDWRIGDAMVQEEVAEASLGAHLIVHGANPPGYKNWRGLAIPMLQNTIHAAIANKSRIVFPGNVYNFGPETFPLLTENFPQRPVTRKGQVRVEMEQMLQEATNSGAKALIVRGGDFFGPHAPSTWFSAVMVKAGKPVRKLVYPGKLNIGHAWTYLPDLAQTVVELVKREERLSAFEVFHLGGHYLENGHDLAASVKRAAGIDHISMGKFPWFVLALLIPFVPLFRELWEMRYLWKTPVQLDNQKLMGFLGREPHTPLDEAIHQTLQGMGCLPKQQDVLTQKIEKAS